MDGLLAEINAKRKALSELERDGSASSEAGPSSRKYMKRSEIEAAQEAEAQRKREALRKEKEARLAAKAASGSSATQKGAVGRVTAAAGSSTPGGSSAGATPEPERESFAISPEECTRRLRSKAQPVRLFGETDKDRRLRLRALELLDERGGGPGFNDNDFRKTMADMEVQRLEREAREGLGAGSSAAAASKEAGTAGGEDGPGGKEKKRVEVGLIDLELVKTDIGKLNPLIYHYLKVCPANFRYATPTEVAELSKRVGGMARRSAGGYQAFWTGQARGRDATSVSTEPQAAVQAAPHEGKRQATAVARAVLTLVQELDANVVRLLAEMIHNMQLRSYQKANDAYLRLSIGNAAWPIGVTSVGIHGRNARDRIGEDSVAHVLNDEVSRKYIQAVKR